MAETDGVESPSLEAKSPFELRVNLSKDLPESDFRAALASGDLGFVHSFTTGSAVDGPGVRVVVWTAGCMWRCRYCHNPDTWTMSNGLPVRLTTAVEELGKYRHGLKVMRGGLTISGGEPLMQDRFVAKFCNAARAMGVHTAIETNGYNGHRMTDEDLGSVDLILLGLKAWGDRHKEVTGMDMTHTVEFATRLAALRKPVWVRFVLVPGLTDDPGEIRDIASFAASLGNVERVEVLPFHQMGRFKWQRLGLEYTLQDTEPPSVEATERACQIFRDAGLTAN
jgi:pyruvate formate lyase activating enzyme